MNADTIIKMYYGHAEYDGYRPISIDLNGLCKIIDFAIHTFKEQSATRIQYGSYGIYEGPEQKPAEEMKLQDHWEAIAKFVRQFEVTKQD